MAVIGARCTILGAEAACITWHVRTVTRVTHDSDTRHSCDDTGLGRERM